MNAAIYRFAIQCNTFNPFTFNNVLFFEMMVITVCPAISKHAEVLSRIIKIRRIKCGEFNHAPKTCP